MAKTIFASSELASRVSIIANHDIVRGEVVSMNGIVGVAVNHIPEGRSGVLLTEGIFEVEKREAEMNMPLGCNVYLHSGKATNIPTFACMGKAIEDSEPGDANVKVRISARGDIKVISMTQAEYDDLDTYDRDTLYLIVEYPSLLEASLPEAGAGDLVEMVFDVEMGAVPTSSDGIRFYINGEMVDISELTLDEEDSTIVTFVPATTIQAGDVCHVSVNPGVLESDGGVEYLGCSLFDVSNIL